MNRTMLSLSLLVALGPVAGWVAGCQLFPESSQERITQFIADLNNVDRSSVYENFHPDIAQYDTLKDLSLGLTFWNVTHFPFGYAPFHIQNLSAADPTNVTGTITADGVGWVSEDVKFVMRKLGNDWMISEMWMDPSPGPVVTQIIW